MAKMSIVVDARGGDKKCAFNFTWEGDDAAIRSIISGIEKSAALAGVATRQLTRSYLKYLPAMGLRKNKNEQQIQMVAILVHHTKLVDRRSPWLGPRLRRRRGYPCQALYC